MPPTIIVKIGSRAPTHRYKSLAHPGEELVRKGAQSTYRVDRLLQQT